MEIQDLYQLVHTILDDMQAIDVITIDVRKLTAITDYMVICQGSSQRHVKSIAEELIKAAKAQGISSVKVEGKNLGRWVLIDLIDIVVHVMLPEVREFYQLEKIWQTES